MEVSDELYAPDTLASGNNSGFNRRLDGTQKQSGRYGEEKELFLCRDSNN
jgi:hypothetical protein